MSSEQPTSRHSDNPATNPIAKFLESDPRIDAQNEGIPQPNAPLIPHKRPEVPIGQRIIGSTPIAEQVAKELQANPPPGDVKSSSIKRTSIV